MRVFIADDESEVVTHLKSIVEELGHDAVGFTDGSALTQALSSETCDLVILDCNLRGHGGAAPFEWIKTNVPKRPPVIIMAKRSAKRDITEALNAGADDYITKPEDRKVIAARVTAVLRGTRVGGAFDTEVTYGNYHMNRLKNSVTLHDETVLLTTKEFELAELFFKNSDRTLSREFIMQTIWRITATLATRTLDMHISRVRAKLHLQPENGFRIFTVFGYGYRLESFAA